MRSLVVLLLSLHQLFLVSTSTIQTEQGNGLIINRDSSGNTKNNIVDITSEDTDFERNEKPVYNTPVTTPSSPVELIDMSESKDVQEDNKDEESVQVSQAEEVVNTESLSLFPHEIGIRNHARNCYASALISCLYNIPIVQKSLFEEVSRSSLRKEESIIMALATIFYKMRFGKSFIDLEPFFMPAVKKTLEWDFGNIECVLEFWNKLSTALPESLFQIELQENRSRKSDNLLIKSVSSKSNLILVSPSKKYRNIEEFLENDFVDEEAEDFIIESKEIGEYPHLFNENEEISEVEGKIQIPSKTSLKILNCPDVLIFGIKRVRWNSETGTSEFDSTHLGFPEKLTMNTEEYTIVGNVEYDEERVHYFAQNHDILDDQWYTHDDKSVTMIPDTEEDFYDLTKRFIRNSTMVFYVKTSSLEEFLNKESVEISKEVVTKITSRSRAQNSTGTLNLKRKRNEEVKESEKPVEPVEPIEPVKTEVENEVKAVVETKRIRRTAKQILKTNQTKQSATKQSKAKTSIKHPKQSEETITTTNEPVKKKRSEPKDIKDSYFESSSGPILDFRLGSKQFLFSKDDRNPVLEPILMAFASHPKMVRKLFESVQTKQSSCFEFKFALVVLRMLTGHMAVAVGELTRESRDNRNVDFNDIPSTWRTISQLISPEISSIPDLKIVTYKGDEPLSIQNVSKCDFYSLKPLKNVQIPKGLDISGVVYDSIENESEGTFNRNIIKSSDDAIILPLPIERIIIDQATNTFSYDSKPVDIHFGPYLIYGYIGIDPKTSSRFAVFSDHLRQARLLVYSGGIPMYKIESAEFNEIIMKFMRHNSVLFFLTKSEGFFDEMPMLSEVPKILLHELILSI